MSLQNDLLADLESDEEEESVQVSGDAGDSADELSVTTQASLDALKAQGDDVTAQDLISRFNFKHVSDVKSVSSLMTRLSPILHLIDTTASGDATEYSLLVEANSYSVEIDNEILIVHQFIKEHYHARFAELETLVQSPVEYAKSVLAIGNNVQPESSSAGSTAESPLFQKLKGVVSPATFMVISIAAYESKGEPLSEAEMATVISACELLLALDASKGQITMFVSSRLAHFAPNMSAIIGAHTTAQLLGVAGGLKKLIATPSSNIPSLGSKSQIAIGFGHTGIRQRGFLYHSPIIQNVPPEFRTQAMRIVSGKIALAARIDLASPSKGDEYGREVYKNIQEKIEKLLEPPENKATKALPIPIDKPSKKRAGRRIQKFKEQYKMTELQKAQNRMTFGTEETYDDDLAELGGTLGTASARGLASDNSGRIRALPSNNRSKVKISKGMANRLQRVQGQLANHPKVAGDILANGMVSSVNFSQFQGIELVDPSKQKESAEAAGENQGIDWFKSGSFNSGSKN